MIGQAILKYLKEKGITQTSIAERTGMGISTLNAILHGNRRIEVEEYFKICKVLEVSFDTFYIDKKAS